MTSALRLRLRLGPSRRLAAAIVSVHAAAGLCATLPWAPPALVAAIASLFVLLGVLLARRVAMQRSGRSPTEVELAPDGLFAVCLRDGTRIQGGRGVHHVTRYWVVLRCSGAPAAATVLLTADMLGAADFRRLRVWALWGGVGIGAIGPI